MSEYRNDKQGIPTTPLPDAVVKFSLTGSLVIVGVLAMFMVLTGFTRAVSLPTTVIGPPGPVAVAVGPQGGTQTPDLSDEGATGPQGLLGSVLVAGPPGPKGDPGANGATGATGQTGATGATGATGPMGPTGPGDIGGSNNAPGEGQNAANCVTQLVVQTPVDTADENIDQISTMTITGDFSRCVGQTLRAKVNLDDGTKVWAVYRITSAVQVIHLVFNSLTGDFFDTKPIVSGQSLEPQGSRVGPVLVANFGQTTVTVAKAWQ